MVIVVGELTSAVRFCLLRHGVAIEQSGDLLLLDFPADVCVGGMYRRNNTYDVGWIDDDGLLTEWLEVFLALDARRTHIVLHERS